MAVTFVAGANNKANNTAPKAIVPASCAVDDVVLIHLTQNAADALTATPSQLHLIDTNAFTSTFPGRLYWARVDGSTVLAGGTFTWTLSTTRAWATVLYAARGVDPVNPIHGFQPAAAAASPPVMPSLVTTIPAWLLELVAAKSNGTIITGFTPPAGWTVRQTTAAFATFAGAAAVADRDAGTAAAGTYGGETYTPSSADGAYITYVVALKPAASGSTGTAVSTLPRLSQSAAGTRTVPSFQGVAVSTLPHLGQAATGTRTVPAFTGTATSTLPSFGQSAAGATTVPHRTGTATQTLPSLTQTASGHSAVPSFTGAAAQTLPAVTQSAVGQVQAPSFTGVAAQTLPAPTQAARGSVTAPGRHGSAASNLPSLTQVAIGTAVPPIYTAAAAQILPPLSQRATGLVAMPGVVGSIAQGLPALIQTARGTTQDIHDAGPLIEISIGADPWGLATGAPTWAVATSAGDPWALEAGGEQWAVATQGDPWAITSEAP